MAEELRDARHLTLSTLDELWGAGSPLVLPIQGEPPCEIRLDPAMDAMTFVAPLEHPEPDVTRLKNVSFRAVADDQEARAWLTFKVEGGVHGVYGLITALADGIQLARLPLASAFAQALASHKNVLERQGAMSIEREVGLFGELLLLEFLFERLGPEKALACWQGPLSEEHDFTMSSLHLEVKTTVTERRRHVIHGLDQLMPTQDIPLMLVSIQLTRAAPESGRTLPTLVVALRKRARGFSPAFDEVLAGFDWRDEDAGMYQTSWALRTRPRAFAVNGEFPAITTDRIAAVVPNSSLVLEVSYGLDLSGLPHAPLPDVLDGFAE